MRTVTMKSMLTSLAALDGTQTLADVTPETLAGYAEYLTMALRYAWLWAEWPELNRVRARTTVDGLITWHEDGQPSIGTVYAVTLDDPDTTVNPRGVQWRHDSNGGGIRVFKVSGEVYVRHTRTSPIVSIAAYDNGASYEAEDVVYDATQGECYEATQTTTGHGVTDATYWRRVELPAVFRSAVTRGAYALKKGSDGLTETETVLKNSMDGMLVMEIDQFRNRGGQHQSYAVLNH